MHQQIYFGLRLFIFVIGTMKIPANASLQAAPATVSCEKKHNVPDTRSVIEAKVGINGAAIYFGKRLTASKVYIRGWLENPEDKLLTIKNIISCCGCVVHPSTTNVIPPHGKLPIDITIDGRSRLGEFSRKVMILTDSHSVPTRQFLLSGEFYDTDDRLVAFPASINLDGVEEGKKIEQVFLVHRVGKQELGDISFKSSVNWISVSMNKERSTSKELALLTKIDIPYTPGKVNSQIYVQGKNTDERVEIPIEIVVRRKIDVVPATLLIAGDQLIKTCHITIKGNAIGSIKKWMPEIQNGEVKTCRIVHQSDQETELELQILPRKKGYISGKVDINFEKLLMSVSIPIVGWIDK